jgi:hypothetical protein
VTKKIIFGSQITENIELLAATLANGKKVHNQVFKSLDIRQIDGVCQ